MPRSFLDLPCELRLTIYGLLSPVDRDAYGERKTISPYKRRKGPATHILQLIRTCHQIHDEVVPLVYEQQRMRLTTYPDNLKWLNRVGRNRVHIRHVILNLHTDDVSLNADENRLGPLAESILQGMLELESLVFLNSWRNGKPIHPSRPTLTDALAKLSNLRKLQLDSSYSFLDYLENKPRLESLDLGAPLKVRNGDTRNGHFRSLLEGLEDLKHLSYQNNIETAGDFSVPLDVLFHHLPALASFRYSGRYLGRLHVDAFTARHGSTLRSLELFMLHPDDEEDIGVMGEESPEDILRVQLPVFARLFEGLPVLQVLRLSCTFNSSAFSVLPPSLRTLDMRVWCDSHPNLEKNMMSLHHRCQGLKNFMIYNRCGKPFSKRCKSPPGWHEAIQYLSSQKIAVVAPTCIAVGCRHTEDAVDFFHMKETMEAYRNDFREPISSRRPDGQPWATLLDYEAAAEVSPDNERRYQQRPELEDLGHLQDSVVHIPL